MNSTKNLHIFYSTIENETRLLKEVHYTTEHNICDSVHILGISKPDLPTNENISDQISIHRISFWKRTLPSGHILLKFAPLKMVVMIFSVVQYQSLLLARAIAYKPTHVSCHNSTLLPISVLIAKITRSKMIYAPHELESGRAGVSKFQNTVSLWFERLLIKFASSVIVVVQPISEFYQKTFNIKKIYVVRNMPTRQHAVIDTTEVVSFRDKFKIPKDSVVFIYQGIFGQTRYTEELVEVFAKLGSTKAHLVLMGSGEASFVEKLEKILPGQNNIHIHQPVAIDKIVSQTSTADVGIFVHGNPAESYRHALPNKIFEYIHGGLPVVVSNNMPYLNNMISQRNLGWNITLSDLPTFLRTLSRQEIEETKSDLQKRAHEYVWEVDAAHFIEIYT